MRRSGAERWLLVADVEEVRADFQSLVGCLGCLFCERLRSLASVAWAFRPLAGVGPVDEVNPLAGSLREHVLLDELAVHGGDQVLVGDELGLRDDERLTWRVSSRGCRGLDVDPGPDSLPLLLTWASRWKKASWSLAWSLRLTQSEMVSSLLGVPPGPGLSHRNR